MAPCGCSIVCVQRAAPVKLAAGQGGSKPAPYKPAKQLPGKAKGKAKKRP